MKLHGIEIKDKDDGNRKMVIKSMNGVMDKIKFFVNIMVVYSGEHGRIIIIISNLQELQLMLLLER
jgi:hypothetical protein